MFGKNAIKALHLLEYGRSNHQQIKCYKDCDNLQRHRSLPNKDQDQCPVGKVCHMVNWQLIESIGQAALYTIKFLISWMVLLQLDGEFASNA